MKIYRSFSCLYRLYIPSSRRWKISLANCPDYSCWMERSVSYTTFREYLFFEEEGTLSMIVSFFSLLGKIVSLSPNIIWINRLGCISSINIVAYGSFSARIARATISIACFSIISSLLFCLVFYFFSSTLFSFLSVLFSLSFKDSREGATKWRIIVSSIGWWSWWIYKSYVERWLCNNVWEIFAYLSPHH